MRIKCNECGHIGEESEFPTGRDFFQNAYVAACPKCDNRQNPGDATIRMVGGERPFAYIRDSEPSGKDGALDTVMHRSEEAS